MQVQQQEWLGKNLINYIIVFNNKGVNYGFF